MIASVQNLLSIIKEPKQFVIPIYQRTYSWKIKQCALLFSDILKASESKQGHFIGSIVYFQPNIHSIAEIDKYLVIDGQQRLTTITLLILALVKFIEENPNCEIETTAKKLRNYYLFNSEEDNDLYYKLLLTKKDKETLNNLLRNRPLPESYSKRIIENQNFFYEKITRENINNIYKGLQKLIVVNVTLERDKDNPQLIFESLNSTGLNLSQADLIRNYILMGQDSSFQEHLYKTYWYPMEQGFNENISSLPSFMRDYLTMKLSSIPKISDVYDIFKEYFNSSKEELGIEAIVKELYEYSQYYTAIALQKEDNDKLKTIFKEFSRLTMETSYPFLMAIYADYQRGVITQEEFIEILTFTKNYVFRRAICGIPTNSLNKTFATLYKSIDKSQYADSVKANYLLMDGYRRFPNDAEFKREIQLKDVYNFRSRNYLLESLENYDRRELVSAENYTIEHIIPQNPKLSIQWQKELGENWEQIKEKYLHTLGNLSLTAYNSELSDRPFSDKKTITGGFDHSPLFLNESVRSAAQWNESAIKFRSEILADRAVKVWSSPKLSEKTLDSYRNSDDAEITEYNIEYYEYLQNEMLDLYKEFSKKVLNIDPIIRVEFKKLYIAFKAQTNFVDVVPQKSKLKLLLNIDFDKIRDPKNFCKDVSDVGKWGNGNVAVNLCEFSELNDIIELVKQAFEEQMEL